MVLRLSVGTGVASSLLALALVLVTGAMQTPSELHQAGEELAGDLGCGA